ncbi:hypothetical protein MKZ38_009950 [Zalerion maritima]|uniref:Gag protein n=1 Tax=Zalerion maritima TaxID=339359 RepID=A0AAD5WM66_9PEZI|nr:hypothetical protein MKZ38_009950 [Zalerion maritima]
MRTKPGEAILSNPLAWEAWDDQFRARAVDSFLWDYINPDTQGNELLSKPIEPRYSDFPRNMPRGPAQRSTQTIAGAPGAPTGKPQGPLASPSADPIHIPPASNYRELSSEQQKAYQFLTSNYNHELRHYKEEQKLIRNLCAWVRKTVDSSYQVISCNPTKSLREWYTSLRTHVKPSDMRLDAAAEDFYNQAIVPLDRPPRDFAGWLQNWTTAMAKLTKRDLPAATRPQTWLRGFMRAIYHVKPHWSIVHEAAYKPAVTNGTLNYLVVANDFMEELLADSAMSSGRVRKRSFHSQKGHKNNKKRGGDPADYTDEPPNKRRGGSSGRGRRF